MWSLDLHDLDVILLACFDLHDFWLTQLYSPLTNRNTTDDLYMILQGEIWVKGKSQVTDGWWWLDALFSNFYANVFRLISGWSRIYENNVSFPDMELQLVLISSLLHFGNTIVREKEWLDAESTDYLAEWTRVGNKDQWSKYWPVMNTVLQNHGRWLSSRYTQ